MTLHEYILEDNRRLVSIGHPRKQWKGLGDVEVCCVWLKRSRALAHNADAVERSSVEYLGWEYLHLDRVQRHHEAYFARCYSVESARCQHRKIRVGEVVLISIYKGRGYPLWTASTLFVTLYLYFTERYDAAKRLGRKSPVWRKPNISSPASLSSVTMRLFSLRGWPGAPHPTM